MKIWQELLGDEYHEDDAAGLGPHGSELCGVFDALAATQWFSAVGQSVPAQAIAVATWDEALSLLERQRPAGYHGHIAAPARLLEDAPAYGEGSEYAPYYEKAYVEVSRTAGYSAFYPATLSDAARDALDEYLHHFTDWLIIEVLISDVVPCTFFREQLQWFHAGHFPCGWDGDWPVGKMKVF